MDGCMDRVYMEGNKADIEESIDGKKRRGEKRGAWH